MKRISGVKRFFALSVGRLRTSHGGAPWGGGARALLRVGWGVQVLMHRMRLRRTKGSSSQRVHADPGYKEIPS